MSVQVYIPTPFRRATKNADRVAVEAPDVRGLLDELEDQFGGLKGLVRNDQGEVHHHVNIYVNNEAIEGMSGAVFAAQEICREHPEYFMPMQFENPANPEAHRRTTALEILDATEEHLDVFVAAVGTGGTVTGVGEVLKERLPGVRVVGVEPARSPVLSGGRFRPHGIQGIGASFVPGILNRSVLDDIIQVRDEDATTTARRLAREEGLLVGISSGANVFAACQVAETLPADRVVVTVLCDTGERYLSVTF